MSTQNKDDKRTGRGYQRGPSGVLHRPVSLRLLPEEMQQLRRDATSKDMSLSALARERYLAGQQAENR